MQHYTLTKIFIYPVKSLGGISLQSSEIEERGLKYDRRWMLVDDSNIFITQRSHSQLALINVEVKNNLLSFSHKQKGLPVLTVPGRPYNSEEINVRVWKDDVQAEKYGNEVSDWFTEVVGSKVDLVFMPDSTKRNVDPEYANNKIVSFADGYPFMMIGEESLNELNSRLSEPLPIDRFRPNFVFSGGKPFDEDIWKKFTIGDNAFISVKPCSRCIITTVNQETAAAGEEPLKTLSRFRKRNGKVHFGINLVAEKPGSVAVGDRITLSS